MAFDYFWCIIHHTYRMLCKINKFLKSECWKILFNKSSPVSSFYKYWNWTPLLFYVSVFLSQTLSSSQYCRKLKRKSWNFEGQGVEINKASLVLESIRGICYYSCNIQLGTRRKTQFTFKGQTGLYLIWRKGIV